MIFVYLFLKRLKRKFPEKFYFTTSSACCITDHMEVTVQILERYLRKNSILVFASKLGYKSADTVRKWIRNGRIPVREKERVLEIIGQKRGKHVDSRNDNRGR